MPAPQHESITVRRSELACPAHSLKMMAKAAASEADEVVFDLEDGCAPSQKVAARKTLIEAFSTLDFRGKIRAFRPMALIPGFSIATSLRWLKPLAARLT